MKDVETVLSKDRYHMLAIGLHTTENNKSVDQECEQASWNLS
jgi:hypothetical protein